MRGDHLGDHGLASGELCSRGEMERDEGTAKETGYCTGANG